jgi:predicted phage terminase large subunit-like protein
VSAPLQASPSLALAAVDVERVRRGGFREFVRRAWPQVETAPLRWGWHMDAVCEHLEAVQRRELRDLVINVPPGTSKTLMASVLFEPWVWTLSPEHRFITASFNDRVILHNARRTRSLVESPWWAARWPGVSLPRGATASKAVDFYALTSGGWRYSVTVRGAVLGMHADTHVVDDPIDPQGAAMASGVELEAVLRWHHETMATRFRDQNSGARVLVMQRLHERDLSAEMERQGATVLCLPMRHERHHPRRYARDPRTEEGELLVPERYPAAVVDRLAAGLGPYAAAAQLQQRPAPAGGGIFRVEWLRRYWTSLPSSSTWTMSVDCTFKGSDGSDFVSIQVWCHNGPDHYLVDRDTRRMTFTETCDAIVAMAARWPRALTKLVEAKANGPAVMDALRGKLSGLTPVEPEGGKEARAHAVAPLFASGNVLLPHPERAEYPSGQRGAVWVRGGVVDLSRDAAEGSFEHAMVGFPRARHDDDVDAATQAINHRAGSFVARLRAAYGSQNGQTTP